MQPTAVEIVRAWQEAANTQDVEQLLALSDPQIEIVGPRGSAHGHQILRDWLDRAGLQLETRRVFARDDLIVVEQHGVWQAEATGGVPSKAELASLFRVHAGRVVHYARFESLADALAAAGLSATDQIDT